MGRYYRLNFHLPAGAAITSPDSFGVKIEQPIFHRNMPENVCNGYWGNVTNINETTILNSGDYPMGMWYFTWSITKSGVHTVVYDSIYLDMGANANYNIPW
jgi:hypothetical protein